MSPPATPGIPERFLSQPDQSSIRDRLVAVETQTAHLPQLVADMSEVKSYLSNVKALEGLVRGILGKGILLIVGAVGSAVGVTRYTEPARAPERVIIQKSNTAAKVEACTDMQPGPERDQCAIKILTELMGPKSR